MTKPIAMAIRSVLRRWRQTLRQAIFNSVDTFVPPVTRFFQRQCYTHASPHNCVCSRWKQAVRTKNTLQVYILHQYIRFHPIVKQLAWLGFEKVALIRYCHTFLRVIFIIWLILDSLADFWCSPQKKTTTNHVWWSRQSLWKAHELPRALWLCPDDSSPC